MQSRPFINPNTLASTEGIEGWISMYLNSYLKVDEIIPQVVLLAQDKTDQRGWVEFFLQLTTVYVFMLKLLDRTAADKFSQLHPELFSELNKNMVFEATLVDGQIIFEKNNEVTPEYIYHSRTVQTLLDQQKFAEALQRSSTSEHKALVQNAMFSEILHLHENVREFIENANRIGFTARETPAAESESFVFSDKIKALGFDSEKAIIKMVQKLPPYFNKNDLHPYLLLKTAGPEEEALAALAQFYQDLLLVSLMALKLINKVSENILKCNTKHTKNVNWAEEVTTLTFEFFKPDANGIEKVQIFSTLETFKEKHLMHSFLNINSFYNVIMTARARISNRKKKIEEYNEIANFFIPVIENAKAKLVQIYQAGYKKPLPARPRAAIELLSHYFKEAGYGVFFDRDEIISNHNTCMLDDWNISQNFYRRIVSGLQKMMEIVAITYTKQPIFLNLLGECKLTFNNQNRLEPAGHLELFNTSQFCELANSILEKPLTSREYSYRQFKSYMGHLINSFIYCVNFVANAEAENEKNALIVKRVFELMNVKIDEPKSQKGKIKKSTGAVTNNTSSHAGTREPSESDKVAARQHVFATEITLLIEAIKDFTPQTHTAQNKFRYLETHETNGTKFVEEKKEWRYPVFGKALEDQATCFEAIEKIARVTEYSEQNIKNIVRARADLAVLDQEQKTLIEEMVEKLRELNGTGKSTTNEIKAKLIQQNLTRKSQEKRGREEKSANNEAARQAIQDASKNIIYINKILSYLPSVLSTEVKHFAFLHNIFWCLQTSSSLNKKKCNISVLQNLICSHGLGVETYPRVFELVTVLTGALEMKLEETERVWEWESDPEQQQAFVADSHTIYETFNALLNPQSEKKSWATAQAAQQCINFMKSILPRLASSLSDRNASPALVLEFNLFEIQALRMLVMIGGEIHFYNPKATDGALKTFLEQCQQMAKVYGKEAAADQLPNETLRFIADLEQRLQTLSANKTLTFNSRPTQATNGHQAASSSNGRHLRR